MSSTARARRRRGAALIALTGACAALLTGLELARLGVGLDGFRAALRATARLSLVMFLLTFVASSVNALTTGETGKRLLRYRKYLGNAFAASHLVHLATIFGLMAVHTKAFTAERSIASLIPGAITYSFIIAMVITSLPGPARALGRRRWVIVHKTGMYAIWAIFLASTARKIEGDPLYAIPAGALVAAAALRGVARLRAARLRRR